MANRYWVGGAGNWSDTGHWASSSGGAGGQTVPSISDAVVFDANSFSDQNDGVVLDVEGFCASFDSYNVSVFNIFGDNKTLVMQNNLHIAGFLKIGQLYMGNNGSGNEDIGHVILEGTGSNTEIKSNVNLLSGRVSRIRINCTGSYQFTTNMDRFGQNYMKLEAGGIDFNGKTFTGSGAFYTDGSDTRSITMGAAILSFYGWFIRSTSGLTFDKGTSALTVKGFFAGGSLDYYDVIVDGTQGTFCIPVLTTLAYVGGVNTYRNLTCSGYVLFEGFTSHTISGTFTPGSVNRPANEGMFGIIDFDAPTSNVSAGSFLQYLNYLDVTNGLSTGQTVTITAAAVSIAADTVFMDIDAEGGATPWTGTRLGDAGGNSNITFPAPVTRYWVGGTGNFGDTAHWASTSGGAGGASFPRPQDSAVFDANSFSAAAQAVTVNLRILPQMDWSAATNQPTLKFPTYDPSVIYQIWTEGVGNIDFPSNMNVGTSAVWNSFIAVGRGGTTISYRPTSSSLALLGVANAFGNNVTLGDDLVLPGVLQISCGEFNADGKDATLGYFYSGNAPSAPYTVQFNGGTWTMTGDKDDLPIYLWWQPSISITLEAQKFTWSARDTHSTLTLFGDVTLIFSGDSADTLILKGGDNSYSVVSTDGDGAGKVLQIYDDNSIDSLDINTGWGELDLEAASSQEMTSFNMNGTESRAVLLRSLTPATQAFLSSFNAPTVSYVDVQDNYADGSIPFDDSVGGIDSGNNVNWFFGTLPTQSASLVSAVKRVTQNMSFPQFVFGGRGGSGGTTYALFKKSTSYGLHLFRDKVRVVGTSFNFEEYQFSIIPGLTADMRIVPALYFDGGTRVVQGTVISTLLYETGQTFFKLGPSNFGNSVHGDNDVFIELRIFADDLVCVKLPTQLDVDIDEIP